MKKAIILSVFLLVGCSVAIQDLNESSLAGLEVGMSSAQVEKIMGEPNLIKDVQRDGETYESWIYPVERQVAGKFRAVGKEFYQLLFSGDTLAYWEKIKLFSKPGYEYDEPQPGMGNKITEVEILKKWATEEPGVAVGEGLESAVDDELVEEPLEQTEVEVLEEAGPIEEAEEGPIEQDLELK